MKYRIPGHGISVDQMVVLPTENDRTVIITGAGDGLIRIVGLFPGKVLGSLGGHNDAEEPIELLALSPNKQLLGKSISHILSIHCDIWYLLLHSTFVCRSVWKS